jgi:hypothetical protein
MAKDCTKGAPDGSGPILGEARPIAISGSRFSLEPPLQSTPPERKELDHEGVRFNA